jgi:glutathione S-transferase
MAKYKLSYFAFPGGRGEDCRLALHIAGADFEDDRVEGKVWADKKPSTPFGSMPVLEVEGKGTLSQSNAILPYLGRELGLHPTDPFEAARHEAVMGAVEDARHAVQTTFGIKDADEKKAAREKLAETTLQAWAKNVERQLDARTADGPFFGGESLSVVDLKLMVFMKWFATGGVDHVPADVFAGYPQLMSLYEATKSHPKVTQWYDKWGQF